MVLTTTADGSVDETYQAKGTDATRWVKPAVTKIGSSLWVYQYEASRPGATNNNPGSGNGYHTSAPSGVPLDGTIGCSVGGVVPWINVTPWRQLKSVPSGAAAFATWRIGRLLARPATTVRLATRRAPDHRRPVPWRGLIPRALGFVTWPLRLRRNPANGLTTDCCPPPIALFQTAGQIGLDSRVTQRPGTTSEIFWATFGR